MLVLPRSTRPRGGPRGPGQAFCRIPGGARPHYLRIQGCALGPTPGYPLCISPRRNLKAVREVPEHWLATQQRESFRTGNRYGATDPTNALLNYGYALLEAETRIACYTAGLHPGLGIVHTDKDGRASLVYDLMEAARPRVDRLVLEFIRRHTFTDGECWETREGHCRLDPRLTARVVSWLPRLRSNVTPVVQETAIHLKPVAPLGAPGALR
jgi:hypothetical protein